MEVFVIIAVIYFALFFALAAILADIAERKYDKNTTPTESVKVETPEQIFLKCCGCPQYCDCHNYKSYEQIVSCKGEK